jgi:hypothetical protein
MLPVQVFPPGQFQHQGAVDGGLGLKLKRIQCFENRKPGTFDSALSRPLLSLDQFSFDQPEQKGDMILVFAGANRGDRTILAQHRGQPELLQVMIQQ